MKILILAKFSPRNERFWCTLYISITLLAIRPCIISSCGIYNATSVRLETGWKLQNVWKWRDFKILWLNKISKFDPTYDASDHCIIPWKKDEFGSC